jgi:hypothetical protein
MRSFDSSNRREKWSVLKKTRPVGGFGFEEDVHEVEEKVEEEEERKVSSSE